jgi:hypothetical protein
MSLGLDQIDGVVYGEDSIPTLSRHHSCHTMCGNILFDGRYLFHIHKRQFVEEVQPASLLIANEVFLGCVEIEVKPTELSLFVYLSAYLRFEQLTMTTHKSEQLKLASVSIT